MSEHTAQYRKETSELPIDKQIEALTVGWEHGIRGQLKWASMSV